MVSMRASTWEVGQKLDLESYEGLGLWRCTFDMAEVRVGLGALFLAPKRRFMVDAWQICRVECSR